MKLAIDIGNTSITCGLFEDESTINRFRINEINQLHNHIGNDLSEKVIFLTTPNSTIEIIGISGSGTLFNSSHIYCVLPFCIRICSW